jgi:hypothetical protein
VGKPKVIYEVLSESEDPNYSGPAADGHYVSRFRTRAEAERFARGRTCYGKPADVHEREVSRELARRYGLAS